jgi:hypothetical protein
MRVADSLAVRPAELLPEHPVPAADKSSRTRLHSMLAHAKGLELELIEELVAAVLRHERR